MKNGPTLVALTEEDVGVASDAIEALVASALTVDCITNSSEAQIAATTNIEINAKTLIFLSVLVFHLPFAKGCFSVKLLNYFSMSCQLSNVTLVEVCWVGFDTSVIP
jgi:hypothetical protein